MFIATVAATAALLMGAATPAAIPDTPKTLIIGDSISHRNSAENPAWWTYLDIDPRRSTESGSGFLSKGKGCDGTRFKHRLDRVGRAQPDLIIVAGGRNDHQRCKGGSHRRATQKQTRTAIREYLQDLAVEVDAIGLKRKKVIVFSPWGASLKAEKAYTRRKVEKYATAQGFKYREVPAWTRETTLDDVHPTKKGNKQLARYLADHSPLRLK